MLRHREAWVRLW
jgi:hypothetical protein